MRKKTRSFTSGEPCVISTWRMKSAFQPVMSPFIQQVWLKNRKVEKLKKEQVNISLITMPPAAPDGILDNVKLYFWMFNKTMMLIYGIFEQQ